MRWLKRDLWKAGIVVAAVALLLLLITCIPLSAAEAHEGVSEQAKPGTALVQSTPTVDATVTELNKEKLAQEVQQLKEQNAPDFFGWLRMNASILLSTLVIVIGGLVGLFRWFGDRVSEREKRAEERFQRVATGLGNKDLEAKVGAAILLRTFLQPGYEQFYRQVFDLAVAHLRLRKADTDVSEHQNGSDEKNLVQKSSSQDQVSHDPHSPHRYGYQDKLNLPLDSLSQVLIAVFRESYPLARDWQQKQSTPSFFQRNRTSSATRKFEKALDPRFFDATSVRLDDSYLFEADFIMLWMPQASFQGANLEGTRFRGAYLRRGDFTGAHLTEADFTGANLRRANFAETDLTRANLRGADLSKANLEDALILTDTDLRGVKGLTKEQLSTYKTRGAIIDEDSTTTLSQSTIAPPPPEPRDDTQATSAPSAPGSLPTSDSSRSSTVSSKPDSET